MLVYVDDIILTSNDSHVIDQMVCNLSNSFVVQDMGALSYFLGVEIHYKTDSIILSQRKFIIELLQCVNLFASNMFPLQ